MIKILICSFALLSLNANSHGIWFAERSSQLALVYGEGADDLDTVKRHQKIKNVTGFNPNWIPVNTQLVATGPLLTLTNQEEITAVAAMLDNGLWSKTPDGTWHAKGRDAFPNALLSEHTIKYAVHLRGELREIPVLPQQKLQIHPVGKTFPQQKGSDVIFQVLLDGKPVAGARVIRDFVNDPDAEVLLSDIQGRVVINVRNQGLNVIAAIVDTPAKKIDVIDKVEHLATLSFVLPHAAE
ncbi:DUF4198 domain-containing protein [Shewanella sp. A14]